MGRKGERAERRPGHETRRKMEAFNYAGDRNARGILSFGRSRQSRRSSGAECLIKREVCSRETSSAIHSAPSRSRGTYIVAARHRAAHPRRNSLLTYLSSALTKGLCRRGSCNVRGCKRLRRRAETEAYFRPSIQARLSRVSRAVPRRSIHNESEIVPEREFLEAARYSGRHRERERERERERVGAHS